MSKETFYTIAQVAKLFGSSQDYIRNMINKGELTFSKIGGRYIISHTDLMKDYEKHKPVILSKQKRNNYFTDKPPRV